MKLIYILLTCLPFYAFADPGITIEVDIFIDWPKPGQEIS